MITLRPYQTRALDLARAEFARGKRRVLLVAPTGAGKTIVFCAIVTGAIAKGGRVLVVVHRRELTRQTVRKMREAGVDRVGVVAAGFDPDPDAPVQVGSIQTLIARGELPEATLVIFDEAHHHVAAEWGRIAAHYTNAKIVGVTATPERGDGAPLGDLFDVLVPVASVRELIELEFLVPVDVVAPSEKTRTLSADPVDAYVKHGAGRKAVVFAACVADAYELAGRFSAAGHPAACVEGDTPAEERDSILERFDRGDIRVVTNCFVLTEGWDCPSVEVCVIARGCSATGTFLQMVGRVLRPSTGKASALVIDLRGVVHDHGLPDDDRKFSLDGRAISGGEAPVKTCPSCEHVVPLGARTCPHCGAHFASVAPALTVERQELTRISRATIERVYFREMLSIARSRGYRDGWAAFKFEEKFGRFPRALWREFVGRAA